MLNHQKHIRVLFPFVGDSIGGSYISSSILAQALEPPFEPMVLLHEDGPLCEYLAHKGVGCVVRPDLPFIPYAFRATAAAGFLCKNTRKLAGFLKSERIDIVHTNDSRMHKTWALPALVCGVKHVWHQRNKWSQSKQMLVFALMASRIVCISKFVRSQMPAWALKKTELVANPFIESEAIDKARSAETLRREFGVPSQAKVVACFANIAEKKRPFLFRMVFDEMLQRGWNGRLSFIWFGTDAEGLWPKARQSLAQDVPSWAFVHAGFRPDAEKYMAGCDLVLAPAIEEPFGRTLVEAMFAQAPVVAAASGGHLEIIIDGKNGLLAAPDDPAAFADAIELLLKDETRRHELTERALRYAQENFGVEKHVREMERIYRQLARSRHTA